MEPMERMIGRETKRKQIYQNNGLFSLAFLRFLAAPSLGPPDASLFNEVPGREQVERRKHKKKMFWKWRNTKISDTYFQMDPTERGENGEFMWVFGDAKNRWFYDRLEEWGMRRR